MSADESQLTAGVDDHENRDYTDEELYHEDAPDSEQQQQQQHDGDADLHDSDAAQLAGGSTTPRDQTEEDNGRGEHRERSDDQDRDAQEERRDGHAQRATFTRPPAPLPSHGVGLLPLPAATPAAATGAGAAAPSSLDSSHNRNAPLRNGGGGGGAGSAPETPTPRKIYVENLSLPTSDAAIRELFGRFGRITRIHIGTSRTNPSQQKGFAFVEFSTDEEGLTAIQQMHGREEKGRNIRCSMAKRKGAADPAAPASGAGVAARPHTSGGMAAPVAAAPAPAAVSSAMALQAMQQQFMLAQQGMLPMYGQPAYAQAASNALLAAPMAAMHGGFGLGAGAGVGAGGMGMGMGMPAASSSSSGANRGEAPPGPNVFINGMPFTTTESDLRAMFSQCGPVLSVKILVDPNTQKSKGCGFVHFESQQAAATAIQQWNAQRAPGSDRLMQVRYSLPRKGGQQQGEHATDNSHALLHQQQFGSDASAGATGGQSSTTLSFAPSDASGSSSYGPDRKKQSHLGQRHNPLARPTSAAPGAGSGNLASLYGGGTTAAAGASAPSDSSEGGVPLFITYLPKQITNGELELLFSKYGSVSQVSVPREHGGATKNFGFVTMKDSAQATAAIEALNGHPIGGKRLKVTLKSGRGPIGKGAQQHQQQQQQQQQQQAQDPAAQQAAALAAAQAAAYQAYQAQVAQIQAQAAAHQLPVQPPAAGPGSALLGMGGAGAIPPPPGMMALAMSMQAHGMAPAAGAAGAGAGMPPYPPMHAHAHMHPPSMVGMHPGMAMPPHMLTPEQHYHQQQMAAYQQQMAAHQQQHQQQPPGMAYPYIQMGMPQPAMMGGQQQW